MIISHKYGFIFIHCPKTAGQAIQNYLSSYCGDEDIITGLSKGFFNPLPEIFNCLRTGTDINPLGIPDKQKLSISKQIFKQFIQRNKFCGHLPAALIEQRIPDYIWNNYFKFCFERNPWDKTVSHYFWVKNNRNQDGVVSFDDYIRRGKLRWNYPYYTDLTQENVIIDYVAKFENLNKELEYITDYLGIPFNGKLPKKNTRTREDKRHYSEFYSGEYEKYIEVVRDAFKKEIELHGYEFERLEPVEIEPRKMIEIM